MPHPSRRVDLFLVPADPHQVPDASRFEALRRALAARGALDEAGEPGRAADWLVEGGFAALRWEQSPGLRLYANQQGGFRVSCPACGANLVPALHAHYAEATAQESPSATCPACGETTPVLDLRYEPPAAWGRWAVRLADVATATLRDDARAEVEAVLGPVRVVARRMS